MFLCGPKLNKEAIIEEFGIILANIFISNISGRFMKRDDLSFVNKSHN